MQRRLGLDCGKSSWLMAHACIGLMDYLNGAEHAVVAVEWSDTSGKDSNVYLTALKMRFVCEVALERFQEAIESESIF